jgi:hypothetical protein
MKKFLELFIGVYTYCRLRFQKIAVIPKTQRLGEVTFSAKQKQIYWKLLVGYVASVIQFWNSYGTD